MAFLPAWTLHSEQGSCSQSALHFLFCLKNLHGGKRGLVPSFIGLFYKYLSEGARLLLSEDQNAATPSSMQSLCAKQAIQGALGVHPAFPALIREPLRGRG